MIRNITNIRTPNQTSPQPHSVLDLKLKTGEIIKGTIVQNLSNRDILIDVQGKQVRATAPHTLLEGKRYAFQIQKTGTRIELKVLEGLIHKQYSPLHQWMAGQPQRRKLGFFLREMMGDQNLPGLSRKGHQALQRLRQLIPACIYRDHGDGNLQWITRFLSKSGLFWESSIARALFKGEEKSIKTMTFTDLKGALLHLYRVLTNEKKRQGALDTLCIKIQEAIHIIEEEQLFTLSSMKDGIGWAWYIPGFEEDGFNNAELFFKDLKDEEEIYFSLFLDFTRLGHVEAEISIRQSVVRITLFVENNEIAALVTESLPHLEYALRCHGIVTNMLTCQTREVRSGRTAIFPYSDAGSPGIHMIM